MQYWNADLTQCTMTTSPPNEYHKDDTINDFMIWVRHTELESDAIDNIQVLLKAYEKKYDRKKTFLQKLKGLLT